MPKEDDLLDAVSRKIEIARFHLAALKRELAAAIEVDAMMAPITVQAHLEGVVAAADAATDQTKRLKRRLHTTTMPDGRSAQEHFRAWRNNPLVQHAGCLRNLAMHSAYFKRPVGHTWSVPEIAETGYHGPYELEPYCEALVNSLGALEMILSSA